MYGLFYGVYMCIMWMCMVCIKVGDLVEIGCGDGGLGDIVCGDVSV